MVQKKNKNLYKPSTGATSVKAVQVNKAKVPLDTKAETLVDSLYSALWQKYTSRPINLEGYFVILRWYNADKQWVTLHFDHGNIREKLNNIFSHHKPKTAIGKYVTSISKTDKKKILALKWIPYPDEEMSLKSVWNVICAKYNQGEAPPFNTITDKTNEPFTVMTF